ncbi:hypothetical protein BGZ74_009272 [Mortierella antarctica]|nr:hypothetical protein BGZ74_009272 [Mortierella antarctica]
MKKLSIVLAKDDRQRGFLFPGDTISGQVTFATSSAVKYTCVKINFIGLVSTKVAKSEDQVYVFNQQIVLQGNANNATEGTIDEGNHTWDFTFAVPLQHIPTSGKYRHGSVKYYLIAAVTTAGFLGVVQEIKAEKPVVLKDLINIQMSPYSDPVSMIGSDSTTGDKDPKGKATAVATVRLSRSAYLKGQVVDIEIDLSHPSRITRNPGCWIQLMRKEYYYAGDHAKEYSASVAACSEPLRVESSIRTGKIMATLRVPDDALPSMTTTKIITIHYHLLLLFDMRTKTPFMESRLPKKMNNKVRNKLLGSPGGFQVEVPVIIGTLSDNLAGYRLPKTISPSAPTFKPSTSPPIRQLYVNHHSPPARFTPAPATAPAPAPNLRRLSIPRGFGSDGFLQPVVASSGFNTMPTYKVDDPLLKDQRTLYSAFRNRSFAGHLANNSLNGVEHKPLPAVPHADSRYGSGYESGSSIGSGSGSGSGSRSYPPVNGHYHYNYSNSPASYSASLSQSHGPSSAPTRMRPPNIGQPPPSFSVPPVLPPRPRQGSGPSSNYGYPLEKCMSPPQINMPLPIAVSVEMPTAPQAVDLGFGPASPSIEGGMRWSHVRSNSAPSTPVQSPVSMDYFQYVSPPLQTGGDSTGMGGGARRASEVASAPPAPPYSLEP